jgi:hypothetical protein
MPEPYLHTLHCQLTTDLVAASGYQSEHFAARKSTILRSKYQTRPRSLGRRVRTGCPRDRWRPPQPRWLAPQSAQAQTDSRRRAAQHDSNATSDRHDRAGTPDRTRAHRRWHWRYGAFPFEERLELGGKRRVRTAHRASLDRVRADLGRRRVRGGTRTVRDRDGPTLHGWIVASLVPLSEKTLVLAKLSAGLSCQATACFNVTIAEAPDDHFEHTPANQ